MIRAARGGDAGARQAVIRAAWEAAYEHIYTPGEIASLFAGEAAQRSSWEAGRLRAWPGLVAEADDMVVGTCGLALRSDGSGEVTSLYVDPAYQGQGLGAALWAEARTICADRGCPRMVVYVLERAEAVGFYRAQGAQVIGGGWFTVGYHREKALCLAVAL